VYSIGLIISVREQKFHANFDVENKSSRERKFHLRNFRSQEWKFSGTKVPVTFRGTPIRQNITFVANPDNWMQATIFPCWGDEW